MARGLVAELSDRARELGWTRAAGMTALVCGQLGDAAQADELFSQLLPYAGQIASSGVISFGSIDLFLGVLATAAGHFDEADGHFTAAEALHARIGAPTWLARTRLEWARMLSRRAGPGDGERTRELAGAALAAAEELGMARVAEQARALTLN